MKKEDIEKINSVNFVAGFFDISNDDYHNGIGVSKTTLEKIEQSPAHLKFYRENKSQPTAAMQLGIWTHEAILEPKVFESKYICGPDEYKSSKIWKEFVIANQPQIALTKSEWDSVIGMRDAVISTKTATALLSGSINEMSCFWKDKQTGLLVKCRPDAMTNKGILVGLKTSDNASVKKFQRKIVDFKYNIEAAMCLDGANYALEADRSGQFSRLEKFNRYVFIVVENEPPHAVSFYEIHHDDEIFGRQQYWDMLNKYSQCNALDVWPSYPDLIQEIKMPDWSKKESNIGW